MININVKVIAGPRTKAEVLAEPTSVNPKSITPVKGVVISEDTLAQWIETDLKRRIVAVIEWASETDETARAEMSRAVWNSEAAWHID